MGKDKDIFQYKGATVEAVPVSAIKAFPKESFANMFRAPFGSETRWYFFPGDDEFYSGITGAIGISPYSNKGFLHKASKELAFQGIDSDVKWGERADYGSCFHLLVSLHEMAGFGSPDGLVFKFDDISDKGWRSVMDQFLTDGGYQHLRLRWEEDLQNDMAAYFRWKKEYEVEVAATEIMVRSTNYRIATPLDLIVKMKFGKGKILANVNLKTGDRMFGDDYYVQAAMEAYLYNQMAPAKWKLAGSFLLRPKDRKKCVGDFELSKNCINLYEEEVFDLIGKCVTVKQSYKPTGLIKWFTGDEQTFNATGITPYEWLKEFSGSLGATDAKFPI